jgi:hypothetical protein
MFGWHYQTPTPELLKLIDVGTAIAVSEASASNNEVFPKYQSAFKL